jgi:hypothetical protein
VARRQRQCRHQCEPNSVALPDACRHRNAFTNPIRKAAAE